MSNADRRDGIEQCRRFFGRAAVSACMAAFVMMLCAVGVGVDDAAVKADEQSSSVIQSSVPQSSVVQSICTQPKPLPCDQGKTWDPRTCSCQPTRGGPPTSCGPSLTCRGTEICCVIPDIAFPTYFCTSSGVCPL